MEAVAESHKAVLTTLRLLESGGQAGNIVNSGQIAETTCVLCDEIFKLDELNPMLKHLVEVHHFVIAGVKMIADFKKYAEYWKERLSEMPISHFCSVIETNTGPNDTAPKEKFNLLCDILPEDKLLRQRLQKEKLEEVLAQQALEREGVNFDRSCLFCKERFGHRTDLLNHMATDHSFNVGKSDNIVYIEEFMDTLQDNLNKLKCLYCENTFKDRLPLKEHMRKKNHKRIKASNQAYDRFYVINYLEFGKKWDEQRQQRGDEDLTEDLQEYSARDDDWSDWQESADLRLVCLFCPQTASSSPDLQEHMISEHKFDLSSICERHQLNFYQHVKLINFIRRQIYQKCCIYCDVRCDTGEELLHHMTSSGHFSQVPDIKEWDQPQYFFPTYEDDALLYALETMERSEEATVCPVYAEDTPLVDRIIHDLRTATIRQESSDPT